MVWVDVNEGWRDAKGRYRQWRRVQAKRFVAADTLAGLEVRLCNFIQALADQGFSDDRPDGGPEAFVAVATACLRDVSAAWRDLAPQLLGQGGKLAAGAADALVLFAPPLPEPEFAAIYRAHPSIRALLLDLSRRGGWSVPVPLLNVSELQRLDPAAQAAALRYQAASPDCGIEVFGAYYADYARGREGAGDICEPALAGALWGGLLRHDPRALHGVRRLVGQPRTREGRDECLRMMALNGDPGDIPVLREFRRSDPAYSAYLLGLHGHVEVVPDILDALGRAEAMDEAAEAWTWISGEALPRKARLGVVTGAGRSAGGWGERPDDDAAAARWRDIAAESTADTRYLRGVPLCPAVVAQAAEDWGGLAGRDALDLLALQTANRRGLYSHGWIVPRRAAIRRLNVADPARRAPASKTVDPWEHGHYA